MRIESHEPYAAVPIPDAADPPTAVREPPDGEERVIAEASEHSRPACERPPALSEFAPDRRKRTSLFETAIGELDEMSTPLRCTSRVDPEIVTELLVVFPTRVSLVIDGDPETLVPLQVESFEAFTVTEPFARSQVSVIGSEVTEILGIEGGERDGERKGCEKLCCEKKKMGNRMKKVVEER
jgi:hypothetical protein